MPSRRFGIRQGTKLRVIDDFSASGINDALAASETIDPAAADHIIANIRTHAQAFAQTDEMIDADSVLAGLERHEDVKGDQLVGRMFDLSNAYKNLAVQPSHYCFSVVVVWDPDGRAPAYFVQRSLPFGASAAVLAFNWVATAFHAVLATLFLLGLTNFYDDYVVIERLALADSAQEVFEGVFKILGWALKLCRGRPEV